jgi:hypothetical protein
LISSRFFLPACPVKRHDNLLSVERLDEVINLRAVGEVSRIMPFAELVARFLENRKILKDGINLLRADLWYNFLAHGLTSVWDR